MKKAELQKILDRFDADTRRVFDLRRAGKPVEEAARGMNISPSQLLNKYNAPIMRAFGVHNWSELNKLLDNIEPDPPAIENVEPDPPVEVKRRIPINLVWIGIIVLVLITGYLVGSFLPMREVFVQKPTITPTFTATLTPTLTSTATLEPLTPTPTQPILSGTPIPEANTGAYSDLDITPLPVPDTGAHPDIIITSTKVNKVATLQASDTGASPVPPLLRYGVMFVIFVGVFAGVGYLIRKLLWRWRH
jgi:hypothetical protein